MIGMLFASGSYTILHTKTAKNAIIPKAEAILFG